MNKYNLELNTEYWECGDGCCDGRNTEIIINESTVGWYPDLFSDNFDALYKFVNVLNLEPEEYNLIYSIKLDENGELEDVILLNGTEITTSLWSYQMFEDILHTLSLEYKVTELDFNWDIWESEKKLVLELQD